MEKHFSIPNTWIVHSYYTVDPYAPDGSGRILCAGADLEKKTAKIYILSDSGEVLDSFGEQPYETSFFHTGFWQTWSPDAKEVYYQGGTNKDPLIIRRNLEDGTQTVMRGDMEGAPPFGEPIVSGLMGMLYAAGYGDDRYKPQAAPVPFQKRDEHGLFVFDPQSGTRRLALSVNDVLRLHPDRDKIWKADKEMKAKFGKEDGLTLMCYCVRWHSSGEKLLFYFGNHCQSRGEPRLSYVFTADKDLKNVQLAVDMSYEWRGVHWSWHPDGKRLVGYGPRPDNPQQICLAFVNADGTDFCKISDHCSGGHPSVSPVDHNLIVTDDTKYRFRGMDTSLGQVLFIRADTGALVDEYLVQQKNTVPEISGRNPHRVCHHPVFSADGSKVLINTLPGKYAQLAQIRVKGM